MIKIQVSFSRFLFDYTLKLQCKLNCAITIHSLQNEGSFYMIQKIEKGD